MSSQMGNDGSYSLSVTFDVGTDLNTALVMVQNRVTLAMPQLPTPVQNQGITIRKRTPDILLVVNFYFARRPLRRPLSEQFRHDQRPRRIAASGRRVGRDHLRPARLQHPRLARSAENGRLRHQRRRRGQCHRPRESRSARRADRPAARHAASKRSTCQSTRLGRLSEPEQFADIIVKVDRGQPVQTAAAAAARRCQAPPACPSRERAIRKAARRPAR